MGAKQLLTVAALLAGLQDAELPQPYGVFLLSQHASAGVASMKR
jgi:hypothetical protein